MGRKPKPPKKCLCKQCNYNPPAPKRTICYKCRSLNIRDKCRATFAWYMIKKSAKKRGIDFMLPKQWFINWVKMNGYTENSGRFADQMTIDRIHGGLGYVVGNVQIITKSKNSAKYHNTEEEYPF